MRLESASIKDFRGIRQLDLTFGPRLTVFVGMNGAGKTAVLEALVAWLGAPTQRPDRVFTRPDHPSGEVALFERETIPANYNIRNGQSAAYIDARLILRDESFSWRTVFSSESTTTGKVYFHQHFPKQVTGLHQQLAVDVQKNRYIPVLAYYSTDRHIERIDLTLLDGGNLTPERALATAFVGRYTELFRWIRSREDIENEHRQVVSSYRDTQLDAVRRAITSVLDGYGNLRVRRIENELQLDKDGETLIVNQLSDGEKALLALVGDVARRMAMLSGGAADPLQGEGIVLIDEIELHLHPLWQRIVLGRLLKTFPHVQFIVTTHSPQVLSDADQSGASVIGSVGKYTTYRIS